MSLKNDYPALISKIEETIDDIRDLVVVDENYDDVDSDEFDIYDPSEFNFLIYLTERVQNVLEGDQLVNIINNLSVAEEFETFYASEEDMYGVYSGLDEDGVARVVLDAVEKEISC